MGNSFNYRGLIDRLLEIAGGGNIFEQQERKKRQDYAAIDARNAMQQDFENKRALQSDLLAGNMAVARENNAGALARQQLQGEFGLKDTGLKGDYALRQEGMRGDYGLQQEGMRGISQVNAAIAGSGGKSGNGNNAAYTEAIKGIWADMGMTPEQKFEATKKAHEMFFGGAQTQAGGEVNPMPDTSARGSVVEPNPKNGTKYFKPDPAPTAATGAALPSASSAIQPTAEEQMRSTIKMPAKENLSLMGKRGFGLLRTQAEIDQDAPRVQVSNAKAQSEAERFYSPEEQKKRRDRMGTWLGR